MERLCLKNDKKSKGVRGTRKALILGRKRMTALKLEKSSASLIIGKVQITLTTKCQI
jgi:hypothetical protein